MNSDRFLHIAEIFDQALELDGSARADFLQNSCEGDPELRQEIDSLLAEVEAPAMPDLEQYGLLHSDIGHLDVPLNDSLIGQQLGPYQIIRRVGEGGMGDVYLAERTTDYEQRVAIKIVRHGMSDEHILSRFRHEMRIQAVLSQHPQIAGILDAGTTDDGRPYLVMEYVDGEQIDQYCDNKRLAIQQRLELFQSVCDAVQFAHQNTVLHRDLKPSNILVAEDGLPKLIDFGIAKLIGIDDDAQHSSVTQAAMRIFTPNYASPEQVEGGPLTTASDVYSLGVLLFELMTGRRPYEIAPNSDSVARAILAARPSKPSVVSAQAPPDEDGPAGVVRSLQRDRWKRSRQLSGDLDNIILMAMRKEPERRYGSVSQLAEDIRRHMTGLPVSARRDTLWYRCGKFLRRNRVAAAAALLVMASFVAGILGTTFQWIRAESEARSAAFAIEQAQVAAKTAQDNEQIALWQVYRINMAMVAAEVERGDMIAARLRLNSCWPEARNWEWSYFDRNTKHDHLVLGEASGQVAQAVFFQNGSRLVTGSWDETLRTWDVTSGQQLSVLRDNMGQIGHVVGSADGRLWATSSWDGFVRVWDTAKETVVAKLDAGRCYLAFSPDGATLATASFRDYRVQLWNSTTGQQIALLPDPADEPPRIAFSADGQRMAYPSNFDVVLWDPNSKKHIASLEGHKSVVDGIAFSHDSRRLVTGGSHPSYEARLWDATTGEAIAEMRGHTGDVVHASFNQVDNRIATVSLDTTVRLWNGNTGEHINTMNEHRAAVTWSAFSPDGAYLASCSYDKTVRIWDGQTGSAIRVLAGHTNRIHSVTFSPDSRYLVSCSADTTARLWDLSTHATDVLRGHGNYVYDVSWMPTHSQIASASWDGTVRTWDAKTGEQIAVYEPEPEARDLRKFEIPFFAVDCSSDGARIAAVRGTGDIHVWDTATGHHRVLRDMAKEIVRTDVEFFPDDKNRLVYQRDDGSVIVRNLVTDEQAFICQLPKESVYDVSVSGDGCKLALGLTDRTTRVWDIRTGKETAVLKCKSSVNVVEFSRNDRMLASGDSSGTVFVWDATSGQKIAELHHPSVVYGLAFSPDGTRLATGSSDSMIRLWDTQSWESIVALAGHEQYVHAIEFSSDGSRLISGSGDHTVRIWNASSED